MVINAPHYSPKTYLWFMDCFCRVNIKKHAMLFFIPLIINNKLKFRLAFHCESMFLPELL